MQTVENESLADLGVFLLDAQAEAEEQQDMNVAENAAELVAKEIGRRVGVDKIRPIMDYHYKVWADEKDAEIRIKKRLELDVIMTAFTYYYH